MKTAVSIPDDVFLEAETLAQRLQKSRSELYSQALCEYLSRHSADRITETLNQVCDEVGQTVDPFVEAAARRTLGQIQW